MRQDFLKPILLSVSVFAMAGLSPLLATAQERPAQERPAQDRPAQDRPDDQRRADDQRRTDDQHHSDDQRRTDDQHHSDDQRHHGYDRNAGDPADRYRHDHPRASARCHDGFFTTTRDRDRACTRHGGIEVWLAL
jgi:hypothetical protein